MTVRDASFNILLALRSIKNNKLRSGITIGIIALGIMALVGILTAIEGLKASIYSDFGQMGANTFQITNQVLTNRGRGRGIHRSTMPRSEISYQEAVRFSDEFEFPAVVGISMIGTSGATAQFRSVKTNPNVTVLGVDGHYLEISGTGLAAGRNFSSDELFSGANSCILGDEIAQKFFGNNLAGGIGQIITIGFTGYRVIGIVESKGGSMIGNADNQVYIPIQNARSVYNLGNRSYVISVHVSSVGMMDPAASEAEGVFRRIRKNPPGTELNFSIQKNDDLAAMVMSNISVVSIAAMFIGFITLIGAVIGLMNIMLVSVAERTREIGVTKALGAKNKIIKRQFLTEAVIISLVGGLIGIGAGILIGNVVSVLLKTGFIIPWMWMSLGFLLCMSVGLIAGAYPAAKAARLSPINALRYE